MKIRDWGKYDTAFDEKNGVFVTRWNDNSVVSIGSKWDVSDSPTSVNQP